MKYSYNWLQSHIEGMLKDPAELKEIITMSAFEVEEIVEYKHDYIFDIKVLPDRAHDALSHRGMAREITSMLGLGFKTKIYKNNNITLAKPGVFVQDTKACVRFMAQEIRNINIQDSPLWLQERLLSIGQKPISNVVDATNYVLYDLGKPMHAFDSDKIVGPITVRFTKVGEQVTTLDGKKINLDENILVLADDEGPLDIAGVKGGTKAEVDKNTKNVILTSANFDSALIRKTTTKTGIRTDAAKRFENGFTSELCSDGLHATRELVLELCSTKETQVSEIEDIYPLPEKWIYKVGVSKLEVNKILGTGFTDSDIENILSQKNFDFKVTSLKNVLETEIEKLLGKEYSNPSSMRHDAPNKFSCSSLVSYIYTLAGIPMPSISIDKYVFGIPVEESSISVGDLIFSNSGTGRIYTETVEYKKGTKVTDGIDHVGIYMGEGRVLHTSKKTGGVCIEDISKSESFKNIIGYRRIVDQIDKNIFVVSVPSNRLDIRIMEDLVDEIAKHTRLSLKTPSRVITENQNKGKVTLTHYVNNHIGEILLEAGYNQIYTTSFTQNGDIAIINSVDPKKNHVRPNLKDSMKVALEKNIHYSELLDLPVIKAYEIGTVFLKDKEELCLSVGAYTRNKKEKKFLREKSQEALAKVFFENDISLEKVSEDSTDGLYTAEYRIVNSDIENLYQIKNLRYDDTLKLYKAFSMYPYITRDISFIVPKETDQDLIKNIIKNSAGDLCTNVYKFDEFSKSDQELVSYGYRCIFQSFEKTLSDLEIAPNMQAVYSALKLKNWTVR